MEVRKVVEEWEIWDEEEEAAKSEAEAKKLVLEKFHRWIKVFGKKQSERMLTVTTLSLNSGCNYGKDLRKDKGK